METGLEFFRNYWANGRLVSCHRQVAGTRAGLFAWTNFRLLRRCQSEKIAVGGEIILKIFSMTQVKFLNQCRACGNPKLKRFLNLPAMPLTDDFIPKEKFGQEFRHDIDVFVCEKCLTAQTQHNVDMGDYYEDYQYAVGGSQTASRFMRLLA